MQVVNLSTQKPGIARTTACVSRFIHLGDPSPFSAADSEHTVNHPLFNTSLSLLFNMQIKVLLQRPLCS